MTETLAEAVSQYFGYSGPPLIMPLGPTVGSLFGCPATSSVVSNFEFGSLVFIWDLFFGAWNFLGLDPHPATRDQ